MTAREEDINGFITVKRNPISKVGVFPYLGKSISKNLDPNKIYWVYRPAEELCKPETIESFRKVPLINNHTMLGKGATPTEQKGVDGVTGDNVEFDGDFLYADLKIFSESMKKAIQEDGKTELSMGYRVGMWDPTPGVFNGQMYDFVQRQLLGNHVALVDEGRMGKEVAVLDSREINVFDSMEVAMDADNKSLIKRYEDRIKEKEIRLRSASDPSTRAELKEDIKDLQEEVQKLKRTTDEKIEDEAVTPHGKDETDNTKGNDMAEEEKKAMSMDDVKAFIKGHAKDRKTFDKLMDEMRPAEDADTEEKKETLDADEDKAKDSDEDKDKDADEEKKSEDADEEKKAEDSAILGLINDVQDMKKNGLKSLMTELNKRNALAKEVEDAFGTFDHAEQTVQEVAVYGLKKAGISAPKGQEIAAWAGYNAGRKASRPLIGGHAMDRKEAPQGSLIAKTLNQSK